MTSPLYTDRLFTQPAEYMLYPRAEHVYECCWCEVFGYHYPATAEIFSQCACTRPAGHEWVVPGTMQTEGTGRRVFGKIHHVDGDPRILDPSGLELRDAPRESGS